jgi:hypothetical protein
MKRLALAITLTALTVPASIGFAQTDAELRALAATFPPMPRDSADLFPFVGGPPTFTSGTPWSDTNYSVLNTDYVDGENGGFDVFLPVDPSNPFPGSNTVKLIRCALNSDLDITYGVTQGDRIILGTAENPRPFFLRGPDGIDNDYAVILHLNYEFGRIQLRGQASDYRLIRVSIAEGAQTDGWYLFHVTAGTPDLVAFIFPCNVVLTAIGGNPPSNPNPYCFADGSLSLTNPRHFRFALPIDPVPSVPQALTQFGGPGREIVGGLTVDQLGNVYVVGASDSNLTGNATDDGLFVSRVAPDATITWTTQLPLPGGSLVWDAAADDDHLYVCGRTLGALPGFTNAGRWDGILLKLRLSDGTIVAQNQWGNPGIDGYGNIILDGRGNLYVSGQGAPPGPPTTDNAYLVAKHRTSDLQNIWRAIDPVPVTGFSASAEAWGGLSIAHGATPAADRLIVAGWYIAAAGADAFVALYENLQNTAPSRSRFVTVRATGTRADWVLDSAIGPQGNIYVAGYTSGGLQGQPLGNGDAFVMRFDSNLNNPIIRQFGTPQMDMARDITIDSQGRIAVFGYTHGNLARPNLAREAPSADLFVQRFDANLNPLDAVQFGTPFEEQARAVLSQDFLYIAGMTEGSLDSTTRGSFDAFVAVLENDLAFACRADFNDDDSLDFFDYLDFVQAFAENDPTADLNRDGTIDFFDYLDFVAAFDLGC